MCVSVSRCVFGYGRRWSEIKNSPWSPRSKRDASFPPSLPFSYHLLPLSVLPHSPSLPPSICPISPVMARFGLDTRGRAVVGKALRMVFHWRGESIMSHRQENTGAFLLDKAPADQTQNTLCPVCLQPTVPCSLGTGMQGFDCTPVPLNQPHARGDM